MAGPDVPQRTVQRRLEPLVAERFEQIVDRVRVKGAQRVLVVGGDEDHLGHRHRRRRVDQGRENAEAVQLRHLHVEKHQLHGIPGPSAGADGIERLGPAAGAGRQFHPVVARQQAAQALAARLFVVHDQRTNRPQVRHHYRGTAGRPGMSIWISTPPEAGELTRKRPGRP